MAFSVALVMARDLARRGLSDALLATGSVERVLALGPGDLGAVPATGTPAVVVAEAETFLGPGARLVQRIQRGYPRAAVVLLVDRTSPVDVWAAFTRGVRGYLLATAPVSQVVAAVLGVQEGGVYILLPRVMVDQTGWDMAAARSFSDVRLTRTEQEVLALLAHGKSSTEIAAALRVSPSTVRTHLSNLCRKTGCPDQRLLLLAAISARWMGGGEPD